MSSRNNPTFVIWTVLAAVGLSLLFYVGAVYPFPQKGDAGFAPAKENAQIEQRLHSIRKNMSQQNKSGLSQLRKLSGPRTELTIATFNLGLLNRFAGIISVPEYEQRSVEFPRIMQEFLEKEKPDIVMLQELWHMQDFQHLALVAKDMGYIPVLEEFPGWLNSPHGLQTLVKSSILKSGGSAITEAVYIETSPSHTEQLVGASKGYLAAEVSLASQDKVLLVNLHLSYDSSGAEARLKQLQELYSGLNKLAQGKDYVVTAGDFNSSDVYIDRPSVVEHEWYLDKQVYIFFYDLTRFLGLMDTYRALHPNEPGFTQDTSKNNLAYQGIGTRGEPEQRLDYIWFGSPGDRPFTVVESRLVFTEPLKDAKGRLLTINEDEISGLEMNSSPAPLAASSNHVHMSDHFGVISKVRFRSRAHHQAKTSF